MANRPVCSVSSCVKPVIARGLCSKHYQRAKARGRLAAFPVKPTRENCVVKDCSNAHHANGFCDKHNQQVLAHGRLTPDLERAPRGAAKGFCDEAARRDTSECIICPYSDSASGYARVTVGGRRMGAHRYVALLAHGLPPEGKPHVLHDPIHCTSPACVNPRHLRYGTHKENMHDQAIAGTRAWGERRPNSILTASDVRDIRERAARGERDCDLADAYGVTPSNINAIKTGRSWKHLL